MHSSPTSSRSSLPAPSAAGHKKLRRTVSEDEEEGDENESELEWRVKGTGAGDHPRSSDGDTSDVHTRSGNERDDDEDDDGAGEVLRDKGKRKADEEEEEESTDEEEDSGLRGATAVEDDHSAPQDEGTSCITLPSVSQSHPRLALPRRSFHQGRLTTTVGHPCQITPPSSHNDLTLQRCSLTPPFRPRSMRSRYRPAWHRNRHPCKAPPRTAVRSYLLGFYSFLFILVSPFIFQGSIKRGNPTSPGTLSHLSKVSIFSLLLGAHYPTPLHPCPENHPRPKRVTRSGTASRSSHPAESDRDLHALAPGESFNTI